MIRNDEARGVLGPIFSFVEENGRPLLTLENREESWKETIKIIPYAIPGIKAFWRLRVLSHQPHSSPNRNCR
jgi:hypothetical protein